MKRHLRNFSNITVADFVVRSAYQVGKTPLLPIFAASLGASDAFLGIIVSVSTLTGMLLKPLIGILSDRWGRRNWLLAGTFFFAVIPFAYQFVQTPEQLFWIRIFHGLSTAIYGPVTLAYVAEQAQGRQAEKLGVFGMARSAGYIVGPALAGWLLLTMDPSTIFTLIGLMSCAAFVPIVFLENSQLSSLKQQRPPLRQQITSALKSGGQTPAVWLSGGLEASMFVALYAIKAFLPIHALSIGVGVEMVGLFFALQEAVHLVLKPFSGRLADRVGYLPIIGWGMALLGVSLPVLTWMQTGTGLLLPAMTMGLAQALVFPATVALVSTRISPDNLGAGMGLIGTLKNAGKVAGPVIGGVLLTWFGFAATVQILGALLLIGVGGLWLAIKRPLNNNARGLGKWKQAKDWR